MKFLCTIALIIFCTFLASAQCPNGPCPDRIQRNSGRCIVKSDGSIDCTAKPGANVNINTSGGGVVNVNGSPVSGGGTPGGLDTQVQFNNAGAFGGHVNFTFDFSTSRVTIGGPLALEGDTIETSVSNQLNIKTPGGAGFADIKLDQLLVDSATPNAPCYVNGLKLLICNPELADGQLLIGDTDGIPVAANITATAPIVVTNGAGTINISCPTCAVAEEFQLVAAKARQFAHPPAPPQCPNGPCPDRIQRNGGRCITKSDGSLDCTAVPTKDVTINASGVGGDVLIAAPGGSFVGGGTGTIGTGTYVDARSNGIPRSSLYAGDGTPDDSFVQAWTFAGSGGYVDVRARSATTTGHIELDASSGPAVVTFTAPGGVNPNADGVVDLGTAASSYRQLFIDATITGGGTTGAQTINKSAGSVNFAAAATSLVVTSDKVTANSIVMCTVATNDATLTSVQCVPGAGSFTMFANAGATAETRVNFWILNQ